MGSGGELTPVQIYRMVSFGFRSCSSTKESLFPKQTLGEYKNNVSEGKKGKINK